MSLKMFNASLTGLDRSRRLLASPSLDSSWLYSPLAKISLLNRPSSAFTDIHQLCILIFGDSCRQAVRLKRSSCLWPLPLTNLNQHRLHRSIILHPLLVRNPPSFHKLPVCLAHAHSAGILLMALSHVKSKQR